MRKSTWMAQLERALSREGMTGAEKRTVLNYYEEMYQDRLDDGAREEDIIKEFGFPEDVAQSVRENDERTRSDEMRENKRCSESNVKDDIPTGTYVSHNCDVESQAYYRPVPQYNASQYNTPSAANTSATSANSKSGNSSVSIARTVVYILLAIVFFAAGLGLSVAGICIIIAAFATIAFSIGVWLIAFGIGLIIFACGCLIFGAAVKFTKTLFNSEEGGAK